MILLCAVATKKDSAHLPSKCDRKLDLGLELAGPMIQIVIELKAMGISSTNIV